MSKVKEAVLDVTNAMHNWRLDPSPRNSEAVTVAVHRVSGFALELELILDAQTASHEAVSALRNLGAFIVDALPKTCATCGHIAAFHRPNCLGVAGCENNLAKRCECVAFVATEPTA